MKRGTGPGDHLKAVLGTDTCVVEVVECPTLLYNGYGEHNIQGIGDKHVPLVHNAMGSDFVIGISDAASDSLNLLFNTTDHTVEIDRRGRERVFNLGYYTWVEQQGIALADFDARRDQAWWDGLMELVPRWDTMIDDFNLAGAP